MKFETYKEIKNIIADYVLRLDKLQYEGYEEDKAYLKNLCTEFQRTVGDEAERVIKNHLDDFGRNLLQREFYAKLKRQKTFKNIVALRKLSIHTDENTNMEVNNLLNDYVALMWKYYGKKTDATLILGMLRISERVNRLRSVLEPSVEVKSDRKL